MLALLVAQQSDLWKQPQRWLVQMGWETAQVVSCVLGRKELEQNPGVDLVLLDAGTAEECGLKLIGVLKSESRLARIPIIVCATDIDHDLALKYMELGVDNILLLPTVRETFEAKVRKASENGKPRVLVVDDEEMIRDLLHDFLKLERYTPLLASSVDEALRIIQTEPVDAIVTDIMMPGKTGIDLLVEVKRDHAHIPVIMITGLSQRFGPRDVIAMGADGYFVKPFHNVELIFTLRKVMGHRERPIGNRVQLSAS
jgi:DNA-binding response OmpR family regulator